MLVIRTLSFFALVASLVASGPTSSRVQEKRADSPRDLDSYEYIIVGSGAAGGTLAARLAINGGKVLLIEAGDDEGTTVYEEIPALFAAASEYVPMSWDFFVRHYPDDDAREEANSKATWETPSGETYVGTDPPAGSTFKGIWYPRAATLGGCAAHNAMVTVYPHEEDWTKIQTLTGDDSWAPENMRQYFERLEKNEYLAANSSMSAGHGFDGWLGVSEMADQLILADSQIGQMVSAADSVMFGKKAGNLSTLAEVASAFPIDMNTEYPGRDSTDSVYRIPIAVDDGSRSSPRDFVLATANAVNADGSKKYALDVMLNTFVTKILFSNATIPVAIGVDILEGASLYSADSRSSTATAGVASSITASKEVIIAAGVFNTPQLLKLSGIGPAAELESFGIDVVSNLPGVGTNLEDHYEISTVIEIEHDFEFYNGCTFLSTADDACLTEYFTGASANGGKGPYATNLLPVAALKKSSVSGGIRDSFIFGGPIKFTGYFQGYTAAALADYRHWSWLSLKAHERNTAGTVTLRSANPLDTPIIHFNYFDAGTTAGGADELDIQPQVEGIAWTREVYSKLPYNYTEVFPGPSVVTDDQVKDFIKQESWGHHASSTAKIGAASDPMAVLDGQFRVRGVKNLRVVDASAFPQVPGFFPVVSCYMIGEKAADVIFADY